MVTTLRRQSPTVSRLRETVTGEVRFSNDDQTGHRIIARQDKTFMQRATQDGDLPARGRRPRFETRCGDLSFPEAFQHALGGARSGDDDRGSPARRHVRAQADE